MFFELFYILPRLAIVGHGNVIKLFSFYIGKGHRGSRSFFAVKFYSKYWQESHGNYFCIDILFKRFKFKINEQSKFYKWSQKAIIEIDEKNRKGFRLFAFGLTDICFYTWDTYEIKIISVVLKKERCLFAIHLDLEPVCGEELYLDILFMRFEYKNAKNSSVYKWLQRNYGHML